MAPSEMEKRRQRHPPPSFRAVTAFARKRQWKGTDIPKNNISPHLNPSDRPPQSALDSRTGPSTWARPLSPGIWGPSTACATYCTCGRTARRSTGWPGRRARRRPGIPYRKFSGRGRVESARGLSEGAASRSQEPERGAMPWRRTSRGALLR